MVCRHGVQLRALNMFQGEIFAYPMYLQYTYAHMHRLFLCQDVICKYFPYLQNIVSQLPDDPKMQAIGEHKHFLSLMHGTTHEWRCQVILFPVTVHPNNICYYFQIIYSHIEIIYRLYMEAATSKAPATQPEKKQSRSIHICPELEEQQRS